MARKTNSLQNRIKEIQDYFSGIEIRENLYIVKITYPEKWSAYNSSDGLISSTKSQDGMWYYYANVEEVDLDDIFDLVKDTIETNESAVRKVEVLKEKMYQLRELFQDQTNSLEKLESIRFVFDCEKPKKKTTRKKKTVQESNNLETTEETES